MRITLNLAMKLSRRYLRDVNFLTALIQMKHTVQIKKAISDGILTADIMNSYYRDKNEFEYVSKTKKQNKGH